MVRVMKKKVSGSPASRSGGKEPQGAWQSVQLARHPRRPLALDYIHALVDDFHEIHGDRAFSDDRALIGGFGFFEGEPIAVLGHQKGRDTAENIQRNFGMAHPEGYRKALRVMKIAEKFKIPVWTLIDTPGAYPGLGAEERGQAEAIARNLYEQARLQTPMVALVIGEGGSGGALGIGVADRVLMLENAVYSVISPEGCSAILWGDASRVQEAAEALKLTARDLKNFGIVDEVIPEPTGGAQENPKDVFERVGAVLHRHLNVLKKKSLKKLVSERYRKFRAMGKYIEEKHVTR